MENIAAKAQFLKDGFTKKLAEIDPAQKGLWGKMNLQQMIEHMRDYVRVGSGKDLHTCVTPEETVPKMQAFLVTEKPFRENTPNSLMSDTPALVQHSTITEALNELQYELDDFFEIFKKQPDKKVVNPFFGELNYDMSVQLLYKHAIHHLKQFGGA